MSNSLILNNGKQFQQNDRSRLDSLPEEMPLTDLANSRRFVEEHRDVIRFCPGVGWLIWDGKKWQPDTTNYIVELGKRTVEKLRDITDTVSDEHKSKIIRQALACQFAPRINGMIDLASS